MRIYIILGTEMPRKQAITLEQRQALRNWAHQQHPKPSQRACINWFYEQYNHKLSQSTVSESLSQHFKNLDKSTTQGQGQGQGQRLRTGQWPDLERILFDFQQRIDRQGGFTSGDILREKAQQIWQRLPQYADQPCPDFSSGWLKRFKLRYNIKQHTRHGEAGSVSESTEQEMKGLQTIAGEFQEEDIYNMDETGLYWKMMPSRGLSAQAQPGIKKEKARITLAFCVNATGSDRFPVWIIGKSKTPRALRNINFSTMGAQWRWNKKAWMNTTIMVEWLHAFYQHIGSTRQVLLTMDNFSAHYSAIELHPPPLNIRICWLPANSTSRFQPLDQGIIQSFKACYRRQWLSYMLKCFDTNQNPMDTMNLHLAIRWTVRSWNQHLLHSTIYNCFRKSTLLTTSITLPTCITPPDLPQLYEQVLRAGNIHDSMAISNFLNPEEEEEQDLEINEHTTDTEEVLQEVLEEHLDIQTTQDEEEQSEQPEQSISTVQDAQQALQVLIEYTERQDALSVDHMRALERLEAAIEAIRANSQLQSTLDGWII